MLAEALVYALSYRRTPAAFQPHLAEAIGLWARGRRQARTWAPHLEQTRAVIEETIATISPRDTVAVLGSGPLFDVPLEALAQNFERVLLIDLAHLSTIARRVARYPNVERVWRDLAPRADPAPPYGCKVAGQATCCLVAWSRSPASRPLHLRHSARRPCSSHALGSPGPLNGLMWPPVCAVWPQT